MPTPDFFISKPVTFCSLFQSSTCNLVSEDLPKDFSSSVGVLRVPTTVFTKIIDRKAYTVTLGYQRSKGMHCPR